MKRTHDINTFYMIKDGKLFSHPINYIMNLPTFKCINMVNGCVDEYSIEAISEMLKNNSKCDGVFCATYKEDMWNSPIGTFYHYYDGKFRRKMNGMSIEDYFYTITKRNKNEI